MKYSRLMSGLIGCLLLATGAQAQEDVLRPNSAGGGTSSSSSSSRRSSSGIPIAIGIDAGVNYNLFSQNTDNYPVTPVYEPFSSASGFSPFFDAYIDLGLSKSIGIQLKIAYDMKNYGNDREREDRRFGAFYFDDGSYFFGDTTSTVRQEFDVTSSYLAIAPLLRINATDNLFFTIGPSIQFPVGKVEIKETVQTLNPEGFNPIFLDANGDGLPDDINDNGTVDDDWLARVSTTDEADNPQSPRIAIEAGAGYLLPLSSSISLVPKLGFQYFLSPVIEKQDTEYAGTDGAVHDSKPTVHSVQLSIGLLFGL